MGTRTIFAVLHDHACDMDDAELGAGLRVYLRQPSERSIRYLPQGVSVIETHHTDDKPKTAISRGRLVPLLTAAKDAAHMLEDFDAGRAPPAYSHLQWRGLASELHTLIKEFE